MKKFEILFDFDVFFVCFHLKDELIYQFEFKFMIEGGSETVNHGLWKDDEEEQ